MPIGSGKVYASVKAFAEDVNGSEYLADGLESGMVVNGIPHEEAQCSSFENQIFDIVVPSYVFEHVNDYQSCLAEGARILKPQGKMYLAILLYSVRIENFRRAEFVEGNAYHYADRQYYKNFVEEYAFLVF